MSEMATSVKVLPDFLIDQIAAGEVVENPASVVKELIENAVDAGAGRILVEVLGGGLSVIRVIDDGVGMSAIDATTAMSRHATSKIRVASDLLSLSTMGFRGEALPSIASVSRFRMQTRRHEDDVGVRIDAEGGVVSASPCACPVGTMVEVSDLFFNVPARLKFQKGERAQFLAISDTFRKAALANPGVNFTLNSAARTVADYPPCRNLHDRVVMVMGRDCAGDLFSFSATRDRLSVDGVLGSPALFRADPSRVILLVNGRPVVDLPLRRVATSIYGTLLEAGRFPVVVADIRLDPADVDVNVHPGKREVRFRDAREVASVLYEAMTPVIERTPWISAKATTMDFQASGHGDTSVMPACELGLPFDAPTSGVGEPFPRAFGEDPGYAASGRIRYLGQVANTILVCESGDGVVFIDQHAAHERINFNRLWNALESGEVASELQVFPEIVNLDAIDMERFDSVVDLLARVGFDIERYSGTAIAVRAIPAVVKGRSVDAIVREAVHGVAEVASGPTDAVLRKIVSTIACHASVRAGDRLSDAEARALIDAMEGEALSSYCPHGRQAVVVHRVQDILKSFDR